MIIAEIWERIEHWLRINAPPMLDTLMPPVLDLQLLEAEKLLGVELPEDFIESYRIHNGQFSPRSMRIVKFPNLFENGMLLSPIESLLLDWQGWQELIEDGTFEDDWMEVKAIGSIQPYWFHRNWIPFASDQSGEHYCMDFIPAEGGRIGQIIYTNNLNGERQVIAESFHDLLENTLLDFESGSYYYSEEETCPVPKRSRRWIHYDDAGFVPASQYLPPENRERLIIKSPTELLDALFAKETDFRGACLHGASLTNIDLTSCDLSSSDLSAADLSDSLLSGCTLISANLGGANLSRADLCRANLEGACLANTNLKDADFGGANLIDADLRGANLDGARFLLANLENAKR